METQKHVSAIPKISELIELALAGLAEMYDEDRGLFCYALKDGQFLNGVSARYSLICLIGLFRAEQSGYHSSFDLDRIFQQAAGMSNPEVSDLGLLLWAGSLIQQKGLDPIYQNLSRQLEDNHANRKQGMDIGVALSGLAAYAKVCGSKDVYQKAEQVKDFILKHHVHKDSHLFYHEASNTFRRKLPNFATQIYLMYGLIQYAQLQSDFNLAEYPAKCLDALCQLQRTDGGWPWIYHVSGKVIEPYEIYSVHQDAMMPMVMQAMSEINAKSYTHALNESLRWLLGRNGLRQDMIDSKNNVIFRSLRRRKPFNKLIGGMNALCGSLLKRPLLHDSNLELDLTCRSYHLGWILEAWCGRESF